MADIYLDSVTGNDVDDGSTRALAKATLQAAITAAGNDGRVFADDGHVESPTIDTTIILEELANPVTIVSVDFAGTADPADPVEADVSAGAKFETVGSFDLKVENSGYFKGMILEAGRTGVGGNRSLVLDTLDGQQQDFDGCMLRLSNTDTGSRIRLFSTSPSSQKIIFRGGTTLKFANAEQFISVNQGVFSWEDGSLEAGSSALTKLLGWGNESALVVDLRGIDLSGMDSSFDFITGGAAQVGGHLRVRNCKLPSGWTGGIFDSVLTVPGPRGELINCDGGDTNYRLLIEDWLGAIRDETTVRRTDGASDGTTQISHKYTTTANAKFIRPFHGHPIESEANFDDIGSALTATLHYMHDGANAMTTKNIFGRVEYLGTSGFPLALFADDAAVNVLSADANQSTSTADWDDGVTGWTADTVQAVGDFIRPTTPDGTVMICISVAGDFKTHATTEPTWPAEGSTVVDDQVTWRKMRREKIDVTFTPQEKGPFLITPYIGKASVTTLFLCPLADVV